MIKTAGWVGGVAAAGLLLGGEAEMHRPWRMHHVNNNYLIANSLNAADVNKDGYPDFAVIDESLGIQTILFHPGRGGDVRKEWPRVELGKTGNPEYSCLGDLDGDGNADLVVVEGDDLERGYKIGVRVFWGPKAAETMNPKAWVSAGHIPGTVGQQYLYCETFDIDGDGALDIVVGGRRNSMTKQYAGLRWIQGPKEKAKRRDLAQWKQHFIDTGALSGHGFVMADLDQDGDADIVDANADWDTSEWDEELYWYENPGAGHPDQLKPWKRHSIWRNPQFYAKPQVGVGDYDGDGLTDLVTQTQNFIHLFRKTSRQPVAFERIEIEKPEMIQWIGRPIKFADLDGDGRLDIVGALIHNDGHLPKDKASVFWLRNPGPGGEWKVSPIKWSDGANTRRQWVGEKWDHLVFFDVDGDGDLDIVGNVEEHYAKGPDGKERSVFSVVWFENPRRQGGRARGGD